MVVQAFKNASHGTIIANLGNGGAAAAEHEHTLPPWLVGLENNRRQAPDILIIKNWPAAKLAAGRLPTSPRDKKRVTLLFCRIQNLL